MTAPATLHAASGVKGVTRLAANVHRPGEEMHDGIATAKDRDNYADVEKSLFQGESLFDQLTDLVPAPMFCADIL